MAALDRRHFLGAIGTAAALTGAQASMAEVAGRRRVVLVMDPADPVAASAPATWAAGELERALVARGVEVVRATGRDAARDADLVVIGAGSASPAAAAILRGAHVEVAPVREAVAVASVGSGRERVTLAAGHDPRGLVYGLLDLADVAATASNPVAALSAVTPAAERPHNRVRSMTRLFCSDVEDLGWFHDKEMWRQYLSMLVAQRFNRFNLAFGIGYDFIRKVTDAYFLFTYPFLVDVPGYGVRVPQLPDEERERNLEMLRFISEEAVARGLEFHVGLWMHGYVWIDSPKPNYTVEGLTAETHGPYCRDALRTLLKAVPNISGVTIRIHGESGVPEGNYDFWKTVFDGVATCGRPVALDMHPKGMNQEMLDIALATKQKVVVSPKYWGEHMGMPYHQADIRTLERPKPGDEGKTGLMKLSAGTRSFLRYGYGDLLREDRPWGIVHRVWPGTQRVLLWGDPVTAAAYSRSFTFCGSDGVELMEPLSFKGRRGSGHAGGRCAYADKSLEPRWDWQKYAYGYRLWGRLLYNPDSKPAVWRRALADRFGAGGGPVETALASASRILPIVTTAHAPSAGNNTYWPELYLNHSFVDAEHFGPYNDSPAPKVFGTVSPLDPQLFSGINEFAGELLTPTRSGRYSPIEVAQWIEDRAGIAATALARANRTALKKGDPDYRRLEIDVAMQCGIGRFFAAKFRSGVLFNLFERTGDRRAIEASIVQYRKARDAWAEAAEKARGVYVADVTLGEEPQLRGHWLDRLPAMDQDIALIERRRDEAPAVAPSPAVPAAIAEALGRPLRAAVRATHHAPERFSAGKPVDLAIGLQSRASRVVLYYRSVNQAVRFERVDMTASGGTFKATIPGDYTAGAYPLQYYFEVWPIATRAVLYPGFGPELIEQPYFVIRQA